MSEPALEYPFGSTLTMGTQSLSASDAGAYIDGLVMETIRTRDRSIYLQPNLNKIEAEIDSLKYGHSTDGWDGYDALPINEGSIQMASTFARLLPSEVALPEIFVENDGEVAFEWCGGRRRIFTISFAPDGKVRFSGLFNHDKWSGTAFFLDSLPEIIGYGIRRAGGYA
jgi:hypothetical protein